MSGAAILPRELDDVQMAFPTSVADFMPAHKDIPDDYPNREKWERVTSDWFYFGLKNVTWTPKDGIDTDKALRHLRYILGSWEPKHEHKEAGVAYLMSLWFEDVKYERRK